MIFIANVGFQYSIEADNEKEAERIMLEKYEESINPFTADNDLLHGLCPIHRHGFGEGDGAEEQG